MKVAVVFKGYVALALLSGSFVCSAQDATPDEGKRYGVSRWLEPEVKSFEAQDKAHPPRPGAIVCFGSSSMRMWNDIQEDLAPLTIIPRGFGGSNMNDALMFADRMVLPCEPRAIVLYEGDNDVAQGIGVERIVDTFGLFVDKVHNHFPECRIYVLSVKPSIKRMNMWAAMEEVNRLLAEECDKDQRLVFVDVASVMFDEDGEPQKEFFKPDDLHMTREGYAVWRDVLRPVLMDAELQYEN
ncbi:SGNH/GDSL hydrolase family protein [Tichowtungia aerotolerans]|nr:SGNH/GDSL hydrolase family protein [Tichowtungia aerotolerans]